MQRSNSFCNSESSRHRKQTPPSTLSRIPTPSSLRNVNNNGATSPSTPTAPPVLRRSMSLRLPSNNRGASSPGMEREVWGVGSGSWGKRQQMRRQQGADRPKPSVTPPVSLQRALGSSSSIDVMGVRSNYNLEDDDDLCSERSYDSTMSVDRLTSRSRRYVVHCNSDSPSAANGASYLTPTQRNALLNKELKWRLRQALEDVACRDREISRLTQECVELRMSHVRRMGSTTPDRHPSPSPPNMDKDSLNSSTHSEQQGSKRTSPLLQVISECEDPRRIELETSASKSVIKDFSHHNGHLSIVFSQPLSLTDSGNCDEDLSMMSPPQDMSLASPNTPDMSLASPNTQDDGELYQEVLEALQATNQCPKATIVQPEMKEVAVQTDDSCKEVTLLKEQLTVTHDALIESKRWPHEVLLSAEEAVLLWRRASLQVQLSRARAAAEACHGDVTLQFLKSAFFHLVTDNSQGATKSHWRAIQSILGFNQEDCKAMDQAIASGTFPGGAW